MADLKTNLLGFAMNSPIIGASGAMTKISTRRFIARPEAVELSAIG